MPLTKYVDSLRSRLKKSFELATAAADKVQAKQKKGYNIKVRGADVEVGDHVLVKLVAFSFDGKHKLADRWQEVVYKVVKKPNADIPVYAEKEDKMRKKRMLNINFLLPLGAMAERPASVQKKNNYPNRSAP